MRLLYSFFWVGVILPLAWVGGFFHTKLRASFAIRREWSLSHIQTKIAQFESHKPVKKKYWFHASSVGEFEQLRILLQSVYNEHRDLYIITYYSPSVHKRVQNFPFKDIAFPLPFDWPGKMAKLVKQIRPDLLVIAKYDAWYNLLHFARKYNCFCAMVSATYHEKSGRSNPLIRKFVQNIFGMFDVISAANQSDADNIRPFLKNGAGTQIIVGGDTRFDSIYERYESWQHRKSLPETKTKKPLSLSEAFTLVIGNCYFETLEVAIAAFKRRPPELSAMRLIIVPHETDNEHLARFATRLQHAEIDTVVYTDNNDDIPKFSEALILNTQGILSDIYGWADLSIVGGSFHGKVHSIAEAAIHGAPVLVGPFVQNSPEAKLLLADESMVQVEDAESAVDAINRLAVDPAARQKIGRKAADYFKKHRGATNQFIALLHENGFFGSKIDR